MRGQVFIIMLNKAISTIPITQIFSLASEETVMQITIPQKLLSLLEFGSFIPHWALHMEPFFEEVPHYFPEYTNHGIKHINTVLEYTAKLLPDTITLDSVSVEILIASIVLHDIGMQLKPDGFCQLLEKQSWRECWYDYYVRACRFSDEEMVSRFGESINFLDIYPNKDAIPSDDIIIRLIIGDFIREQHGLLAYDISINGFPGNKSQDVFPHVINSNQRDLIGVVAYSHQLPLRSVEQLLERKSYAESTASYVFGGVPVYYLMSLLRIADYLDANSQRAPVQRQWKQHQISPESTRQFTLNQITDVVTINSKAYYDSVYIGLSPSDSKTYVAASNWINEIQSELDHTWAVLSEKYNAEQCLTIHRVRSNILDSKAMLEFNKRFLPQKIEYTVNPQIVKLLIAPLYGNSPSYGVRELLQNALDAVQERNTLERDAGTKYEPRVTVQINTKERTLIIEDNGIGMNADIIKNYFLCVGASFRDSNAWRNDFSDNENQAKVIRSGRFGIGVLASFLLGDMLHVQTCRKGDDLGYSFDFSLAETNINVNRVISDIGTKITIYLNEHSVSILQDLSNPLNCDWFSWYTLTSPRVKYVFDGQSITYQGKYFANEYGENGIIRVSGWHKLSLSNGVTAVWSIFNSKSDYSTPDAEIYSSVCVNGIVIDPRTKDFVSHKWLGFDWGGELGISLFDRNGVLPISLDRKSINYTPEFIQIEEDIARYFLANIFFKELDEDDYFVRLSHFNSGYEIWASFECIGFSSAGYIPLIPEYLVLCDIDQVQLIAVNDIENHRPYDQPYIARSDAIEMLDKKAILSIIIDESDDNSTINSLPYEIKIAGYTFSINPKYNTYKTHAEKSLSYEQTHSAPAMDQLELYAEYDCQSDFESYKAIRENVILAQVIQECFGTVSNGYTHDYWIPFEIDERIRKFPLAYEKLKKYVVGKTHS